MHISVTPLFLILFSFSLNAGEKVLPLYQSDEILEFNLYFSFNELTNDLGKNPSYHKGFITFNSKNGTDSLHVEVKARGRFRKNPDNCEFPPLFIRGNDSDWSNSIFQGDKKLKFVSHCMTSNVAFDQYILQEYLVYKAYGLFSPYHFKVRLAKVNYYNTENDSLIFERFGFFIEDKDDMALRNGCRVIEIDNISATQVNDEEFKKLALFQYMMLNNDWAVSLQHNIVLVINSPGLVPVAVPYDFDWAGIINAPYKIPTADNTPYLPERNYKGVCKKRKELKPMVILYNQKRAELYDIYLNCHYLSEENKQRILASLDEYYTIINTRKLLRKHIIKACKF